MADDPDKAQSTDTIAGKEKRKFAVVIVHGMGEQRPLETLRGFAQAVWGRGTTAGEKPHDDDTWLVPDLRSGMSELARVTTRYVDNRRTDFFELYRSDLLTGNKLSQLNAWVQGLLLRWPHKVPRESVVLWLSLWAIVGAIILLAMYAGIGESPYELLRSLNGAARVQNWWTATASAVIAVLLGVFLWRRLISNQQQWIGADRLHPGIWATETPRQASVDVRWSWIAVFVLPIVAGLLLFWLFPWSLLASIKTWALLAAALILYMLTAWVVPVFGDVARYVRTSPDAVSARAEIRDRGVKLMRALHGEPEDGRKALNGGKTKRYERVIVVGHSLGSIVAYDVLRLFWQERGPTSKNPPGPDALTKLRALDKFCRAVDSDRASFDFETFRQLQGSVAEALATEPEGWLVSDFVTLGSPLTHAEFLVSEERSEFEDRKSERMFPTCPPMLEPGRRPSFLYFGDDRTQAHHAAMFAAMRWTNIYDPGSLPFLGDFIGGPCQPNFGPGVLDLPLKIVKRGLFPRLVTHTHYWDPEATAQVSLDTAKQVGMPEISTMPKAHIMLLRKVLALRPL